MSEIINPNQKSELNIKKEPLPVTGEQLKRILQSRDFAKRIREIGSYSRKRGFEREASFFIFRDLYKENQVVYTKPSKNDPYRPILAIDLGCEYDTGRLVEAGMDPILVITLHTHPYTSSQKGEAIMPSYPDLFLKNDSSQYFKEDEFYQQSGFRATIRPVDAICGIYPKGDMKALLFQENFDGIIERPADLHLFHPSQEGYLPESGKWYKGLLKVQNQDQILEVLIGNGYKAEFITVSADGKISEDDANKVENFAFQPQILEIKGQ